jgi:glycosyltransferase involved in cell wall biosynthesis
MEFMSAGKPAIAPRNTALADYIDEDVAFIVKDNKELCCWPQDVRNMYRAHRYRIDWQSLVEAFDASYQISKERPEQYRRMSANAIARMRGFCSQQVVWDKFSAFVNLLSEGTRCESRHAEARIQRRSAGRSG